MKGRRVLMMALAFGVVGSAWAQMGPWGGDRPGSGRFEAAAPEIGEAMPDLTLYDAGGKEVRLRELLRGRYTVLVLGCLT